MRSRSSEQFALRKKGDNILTDHARRRKLQIARFLNLKFEIRHLGLNLYFVQCRLSDLEREIQDLFTLRFP